MSIKINILENFDIRFSKGKDISFLNPVSLDKLETITHEKIYFHSDGFLLTLILNKIYGQNIKRVSFDFTSIATEVFETINIEKDSLIIVGAKEDELSNFARKLKEKYPGMNILKTYDGYFDDANVVIEQILNLAPSYVVVGLGAGKQEWFQKKLREEGYSGTTFSCGGFIRQESDSTENYYPDLIDKLNLRFLYRMIKEPHTISRYLIKYPINILKFIIDIKRRKFHANFNK